MNGRKILIGTTIGAGVIWLIAYLNGKKKIGDKLDTTTSVMIHSFDQKGFVLRIDVVLKNPTEGTLTIKQPYVKVVFDTSEVGTTQIVNKEIVIKPYSAVPLAQPIYLTVPLKGLLKLGVGLYKLIFMKEPAKIMVTTYSSIKLFGGFKSYSKTDPITLKPRA